FAGGFIVRLPRIALQWKRWYLALIGPVALVVGGLVAASNRDQSLRVAGLVETQEVRLGSRVGRRVAGGFVTEGDPVGAGQILVRFDTAELKARRQQHLAAVQAAEAQLERANNGPRREEVQQARAELESVEVDARLASSDFARAGRLTGPGAMSSADF